MDINFHIRQVDDLRDLRLLRDFMHRYDLGYPNYHKWVDSVCVPEIESGYKTAVVAFCDRIIVGDMIWQPHKELPRTIEGKNLRINPNVRKRGLAYFLMKQCEVESRKDSNKIIVDIPSDQYDIKLFLLRYGFSVLYQAPLYSNNRLETVMIKDLEKYL